MRKTAEKEKQSDFDEIKGATLYLVFINLGFYIITSAMSRSLIFTADEPIILFGFSIANMIYGRPWVIITSLFVHGNLAHLMMNMLYLLIYGLKLQEQGISDKRIYLTYLTTGVLSSLLSSLLFFSPYTLSIGASGAVFGILGLTYGIAEQNHDPNAKKILYFSIILFVMATGANTNIFAHLFGLLSGIFIGMKHIFEDPPEYIQFI